jgi:hypothetical protein
MAWISCFDTPIRTFDRSIECMVDPECVSAFGETDEVIHVVRGIAMPERYAGGTDALGFEIVGVGVN